MEKKSGKLLILTSKRNSEPLPPRPSPRLGLARQASQEREVIVGGVHCRG